MFFYNLSYLFKLYNTVFEPGSIINWLTLMSKFYIKFHSLFYLAILSLSFLYVSKGSKFWSKLRLRHIEIFQHFLFPHVNLLAMFWWNCPFMSVCYLCSGGILSLYGLIDSVNCQQYHHWYSKQRVAMMPSYIIPL